MAKSKPIIKCDNVWKIYNEGMPGEVQALRGCDLEVREGEFLSIEGVSGSGKSTLLHCIGCLDKPTRGKVYIEGEDVSKLDEDELSILRRKKIGFVFQFFNIIPSLTALQNVELPMIFDAVEEEKRLKRAETLLKKVGLGKRLDHKPKELSGGERQRVAIARSMSNDPLLMLADEPTGNLDSKSGREIIDIFTKLNKEGRTIVVITHDSKISKKARRKARIKDGKII